MANYSCVVRTNYFRVKDEEAFKEVMSRVNSEDCKVWERTNDEGAKFFAFGGYADINGINPKEGSVEDVDYDDYCYDYDAFLEELKNCVADDDAILIFEAGHEKLRYVTGFVSIVTSKEIQFLHMRNEAVLRAKSMLNDPNWDTKCEY